MPDKTGNSQEEEQQQGFLQVGLDFNTEIKLSYRLLYTARSAFPGGPVTETAERAAAA